ncbi:hypothetical protein B0A49_05184 [Cryomyces minteri]|uniref:Uncharacterized protein n=1 Tax=Cryomyces minteri TaxID=331657 RepID=A0A4U0XCK2_9PEZI|nr:hypothetical protein B0A49_05184 [Cryomyces minteri]
MRVFDNWEYLDRRVVPSSNHQGPSTSERLVGDRSDNNMLHASQDLRASAIAHLEDYFPGENDEDVWQDGLDEIVGFFPSPPPCTALILSAQREGPEGFEKRDAPVAKKKLLQDPQKTTLYNIEKSHVANDPSTKKSQDFKRIPQELRKQDAVPAILQGDSANGTSVEEFDEEVKTEASVGITILIREQDQQKSTQTLLRTDLADRTSSEFRPDIDQSLQDLREMRALMAAQEICESSTTTESEVAPGVTQHEQSHHGSLVSNELSPLVDSYDAGYAGPGPTPTDPKTPTQSVDVPYTYDAIYSRARLPLVPTSDDELSTELFDFLSQENDGLDLGDYDATALASYSPPHDGDEELIQTALSSGRKHSHLHRSFEPDSAYNSTSLAASSSVFDPQAASSFAKRFRLQEKLHSDSTAPNLDDLGFELFSHGNSEDQDARSKADAESDAGYVHGDTPEYISSFAHREGTPTPGTTNIMGHTNMNMRAAISTTRNGNMQQDEQGRSAKSPLLQRQRVKLLNPLEYIPSSGSLQGSFTKAAISDSIHDIAKIPLPAAHYRLLPSPMREDHTTPSATLPSQQSRSDEATPVKPSKSEATAENVSGLTSRLPTAVYTGKRKEREKDDPLFTNYPFNSPPDFRTSYQAYYSPNHLPKTPTKKPIRVTPADSQSEPLHKKSIIDGSTTNGRREEMRSFDTMVRSASPTKSELSESPPSNLQDVSEPASETIEDEKTDSRASTPDFMGPPHKKRRTVAQKRPRHRSNVAESNISVEIEVRQTANQGGTGEDVEDSSANVSKEVDNAIATTIKSKAATARKGSVKALASIDSAAEDGAKMVLNTTPVTKVKPKAVATRKREALSKPTARTLDADEDSTDECSEDEHDTNVDVTPSAASIGPKASAAKCQSTKPAAAYKAPVAPKAQPALKSKADPKPKVNSRRDSLVSTAPDVDAVPAILKPVKNAGVNKSAAKKATAGTASIAKSVKTAAVVENALAAEAAETQGDGQDKARTQARQNAKVVSQTKQTRSTTGATKSTKSTTISTTSALTPAPTTATKRTPASRATAKTTPATPALAPAASLPTTNKHGQPISATQLKANATKAAKKKAREEEEEKAAATAADKVTKAATTKVNAMANAKKRKARQEEDDGEATPTAKKPKRKASGRQVEVELARNNGKEERKGREARIISATQQKANATRAANKKAREEAVAAARELEEEEEEEGEGEA